VRPDKVVEGHQTAVAEEAAGKSDVTPDRLVLVASVDVHQAERGREVAGPEILGDALQDLGEPFVISPVVGLELRTL
jgi:hypothetical protein